MPSTNRSSTSPHNTPDPASVSSPVSSDDRKLVKRTRDVRVRLATGSELEGTLFLGLFEAAHTGPQTVGDLLNGEEAFIPLKTNTGVCLINIKQILFARTPAQGEADELMTLGARSPVAITLVNTGSLEGDIYINLPEGCRRPKDFFNHAPTFFPLFIGQYIVYINRHFVASAQEPPQEKT
jgi:hypothetical protein